MDPWAGAFGSAQEELIATDGEDGAEMHRNHHLMQGNHRLKSFAKAPGGVRVGPRSVGHCMPMPPAPQREPGQPPSPDPPPPVPCPRSVQGWIHKGLQLTELKKAKIKLMVRTGRNSRAPLRAFAPAQSVSPPRAKPAGSRLGSSEKQLQFHAQLKRQRLFSKYPSFPAGKRLQLLLSSSSPPWPPLQLL